MATPTPKLLPLDQSSDSVVVSSAVANGQIDILVNGNLAASVPVSRLYDDWMRVGTKPGFGNLLDGNHLLWVGDFAGLGRPQILFYYNGDGNWFLGTFTATGSSWKQVGNTPGYGNLLDGNHLVWVGDFAGLGRPQILFYYNGDGNWLLGTFTATSSSWKQVGSTPGYGNLLDGNHLVQVGDFAGLGRPQILFYYNQDGHWFLGTFTATSSSWKQVGSTPNFGNLLDGNHLLWVGDFAGLGRPQILFYYNQDGHWFLGTFTATSSSWKQVGSTPNFGNLLDGNHRLWVGDFAGLGWPQILFYYNQDGHWFLGTFTATSSSWNQVGNTPGYGNLLDGNHLVWVGDFGGLGRPQVLFYYNQDGHWFLGTFTATGSSWKQVGSTPGYGNLLDGNHLVWVGDFAGLGRAEILFYYNGDGNWWLGRFDRARLPLPQLLSPGDSVTATQAVAGVMSAASPAVTVEHTYPTQHYDAARTGWNRRESALTVAKLRPPAGQTTFRQLFSHDVDGQVYTQPLYVANVTLPGHGLHNVVYIATENDSVYAFDADSNTGSNASPLIHRTLLRAGETPLDAASDVPGCQNIVPKIGVTGTPVIDISTQTLYVVAKSKTGATYRQRLHALDLTTLEDRPCSPIEIGATFAGVTFDPRLENQRPGLLLRNGVVYVAWAGHCDHGPYYGWIIAYDAATLGQVGVFNAAPSANVGTNDHYGAGIWQGGIGLASDEAGDLYCQTGNGPSDAATSAGVDYGNSVVKLSPSLNVKDFFTPFNIAVLEQNDWDLGSGGPILLPTQAGAPHPYLLVTCGKQGRIYVLDRSNLGRFNNVPNDFPGSDTNVIQTLDLYPGQTAVTPAQPAGSDKEQPGVWGGPAYFRSLSAQFIYYCGNWGVRQSPPDPYKEGGPVKAFVLTNASAPLAAATLPSGALNQSAEIFPAINAGGASPVVSSNGSQNGTGIVWLIRRTTPLRLFAYDATDLTAKLLDIDAGPWNSPQGAPMIEPTVTAGKVYVGSDGRLTAFGL